MPFDTIRMGASAAGAYEIDRSLRFEGLKGGTDAGQLDRDFQAGGNPEKWTFAVWFKKCQIGTVSGNSFQHFIGPYRGGDGSNESVMGFNSSNQFQIQDSSGGQCNLITNRLFRDVSAWQHCVVAVDTTQGTASNRVKIYFNGVQETSWATETYPAEDYDMGWNKEQLHAIGRYAYPGPTSGANTRFNGYMTEIYWIDDQQLTPSSFGKTNTDTGQWVPVKYTGTYGTTGFYLNFSDNSNTTASTLGADSSGNGNNWTPANFSVDTDDEIACDSFSDTPTNNWCIMNMNNNPNGATVANGGLAVSLVHPHGDNGVYATFGVTSGKWYWEAKCTSAGNRGQVGVTDAGHKSGSNSGYNFSVATRHTGQTDDTSGTSNSHLDAAIDSGDWVTMCFDADNGQIWYSREAAPNVSGTANVTGLTLGPGRSWQPHIRETGNPVSNFTFNFGASAAGFKYGPPNDDYKALNAANLPEPTIKNPTDYFNSVLYTGTGTTDQAKTVGFQPDLLWIKKRSHSDDHILSDNVGTPPDYLKANSTDEEATYAEGVKSFDSNGFTLGSANNINQNTHTFVSWSWKESASAGFDIVGYTGTGSNPQTRAHSLGVAPEMIILKNKSGTNGDEHWAVYHHAHSSTAASSANYWARLNTNGAFEDLEMWNDTVPTSSVFTTQNHAISNYDSDTFVAYLFSSVEGYSKVGSYKGNNSSDGPFIYTGFKPAWFMVKNISSGEEWEIYDNARDPDNIITTRIQVTNGAEVSSTFMDFVSNGIKMRNTSGGYNNDGGTFVYLAFAESPFKYANAK